MVDICKHMEHLGPCGHTLSVSERAGLQVSMLQRQEEEGLQKLLFWGKIMGAKDDYLVCQATLPQSARGWDSGDDDSGFPAKKYFYCRSSDPTLVQMPPLSPEFAAKAAAVTSRFLGEPSLPLDGEPEDDPAAAAEAEDSEDGAATAPARERLREEHRLAYIVAQIDREVAVVPRGAWVVDGARRVRPKRPFEGLSAEAAASLRGYRHFRPPQGAQAVAALERKGLVRADDFLDALEEDRPAGIWSVFIEPSGSVAGLRSRLWPGFYFFHEIGTPEYGGVYFGTGLRNTDLAFML
ncbi:unnamed protein product [Phaeothamnion confervicola]